ncbi:MAG: lamin tail domain-containing protein, partial [Sedimentisphaerales bacterium]|nr:lamin tail domain-containing protein [Sedimentisphaerales bacterium]
GRDNLDVNPNFVQDDGEFHLRWYSPARGTGPNGLDLGAYVPGGVSLSLRTEGTDAVITVAGPGISQYRYALDDLNGAWSEVRAVAEPIYLTNLTAGQSYTVYAIGKNSADIWQDTQDAAALTWTAQADDSRLVINEVMAVNTTTVELDGGYPDWIELYNGGTVPLALDGYRITDEPAQPDQYVFSGGLVLDPNQYLVLVADPNTERPGHLGFALDGDGEAVYLYDSDGILADAVWFGQQVPDASIGRVNGGPWLLTSPTPGQANRACSLADPQALKINEWLANGRVSFEDDFIELLNPAVEPVNVSELCLTDNPISQPQKHRLGPLSFLGAGRLGAWTADDQDLPGHVEFRLSADQGLIGLYRPDGTAIDIMIYGPQTTDIAQGRDTTDTTMVNFYPLPTPGLPNQNVDGQATLISLIPAGAEVQYRVPTDPNEQESWMAPGYTPSPSWSSQATPLGFGDVFLAGRPTLTAYNDCCYDLSNQYIGDNVTTFGIGSGYSGSTSGELIDHGSGQGSGITVSFSQSGGVVWQPSASSGGSDTAAGTDAYALFGGIADMTGVIYYGSTGWWVEMTFTGLDPFQRYRFATSANRGGASDYETRFTCYTLLDADGFTNASSSGVLVNSAASVSFSTGRNTQNGYVAQWTGIQPGADGDFTVRAEAHGSPYDDRRAYSFDVFLLEAAQTDTTLRDAMAGVNASLWTRTNFTLGENPDNLSSLQLKMRYEDGFVAYLNGQEVARSNVTGSPQWNSSADGDRPNALAADFELWDISDHLSALQQGNNVLAIQVLNDRAADPNFLYLPELIAVRDPNQGGISYDDALALLGGLRITEIMYHPPDAPQGDPDAEFIELRNIGDATLNLTGVRFTDGIDYTFPARLLEPAHYVVLVKDPVAFAGRYGSVPEVAGTYQGSLSNGGERIVLSLADPLAAAILRFSYNDSWYPTTDGGGYALEIRDAAGPAAAWDERDSWNAGPVLGGTPGTGAP